MTAYKSATHCYYCELPFNFTTVKTKDHIIPKSKGGKSAGNIIAACKHCNGQKGSLTLDEFFNKMLNRRTKKGNQHDNIEKILANIAKLKAYRNGSVTVDDIMVNTHKGGKKFNPFLPPDNGEELTRILNENTQKVIAMTNKKDKPAYTFRDEIIKKVNIATPNFHEEFIYEGIVY